MQPDVTVENYLDAEQMRIAEVFIPLVLRRTLAAIEAKRRFVHYSRADAAMSMLRSKEVWMRSALCMNDFSEINHGRECLVRAYKSEAGKRLKEFLEAWHPGFVKELEDRFNGWIEHFTSDTFMTCISEHLDEEDEHGRLSMWRAYGGVSGVAIVINSGMFFRQSDALEAYTSPVSYLSPAQFESTFGTIVDGIVKAKDTLDAIGKDAVFHLLFESFRSSMLCTKHPAFHEEREWRIIYQPTYKSSPHVLHDLVSVRGVPQPIYKIPLKNIPDEGLVGIEIAELVDRIIIGPTQYPLALYDAFVELLKEAGVPNPGTKVYMSDIPLRT